MKTSRKTINDMNNKVTWISSMMFVGIVFLIATIGHAASVQLQWDPNTESDLAGYRVYYKADSSALPFDGVEAVEGASPVDVHNITTVTINGLDPNHSYNFAVTAYNTAGAESSYSNIVSIPETAAPVIGISSPSNGTNVAGTVSITASATDNVGVAKVEYYLNGVLVGSDNSAPYLYSWNTLASTPGTYTITAKAYDVAGNIGQSGSVSVNVVNDVTAPAVSFAYPTNNGTVKGTVDVTANVSDNVGVSMVEFYENGVLAAAVNSYPYKYSWNTTTEANTQVSLIAKAYDLQGNTSQTSINVAISNGSSAPATTVYTIADATLALQIAIGKVKPTNEQKSRLDVAPVMNGKSSPNGKVDAGDAIVILSKVVGKSTI